MEVEYQLNEAPPVCVVLRWNPKRKRVMVMRFEDEQGQVIARPGGFRWFKLLRKYREEIKAAKWDFAERLNPEE